MPILTPVPAGGTANQILQKNSSSDGDTSWATNVATSTTANYVYQPSWWNMLAYTCPPAIAQTGSGVGGLVAGWAYGAKVYFPANLTATSIVVDVTTAGTGATALANCYVGLYNSSGTRLGVSAELSSSWATGGTKTHTLTADGAGALSITGGTSTYGFIVTLVGTQSTTNVQLRTGEGNGSAAPNVGLVQGTDALRAFRWGNGVLTSLPTSFNPLTATALTAALLVWGAIR